MNIINNLLGKIIYFIAKSISVVLDSIIRLIVTIVIFIKSVSKGLLVLLSMGGCLFFIFFATWGLRILLDPVGLLIVMFFIVFPVLASIFISKLKYFKYVVTEYLFNLSNYVTDKNKYTYKSINDYKTAYRKAEEEKIREEQRRQYEQQRQWQEQFFKQHWYQQGSQGNYGGYEGQRGYNFNPNADFKSKYEKSCDILGIPYNSEKSQIKLAYRKKAKENHPDLNKDPGATRRFQEITDAYEFLSDENIARYRNL